MRVEPDPVDYVRPGTFVLARLPTGAVLRLPASKSLLAIRVSPKPVIPPPPPETREQKSHRIRTALNERHARWWVERNIQSRSYPWIAKKYRKDHTTVISACRRVENYLGDEEIPEDPEEAYLLVFAALQRGKKR